MLKIICENLSIGDLTLTEIMEKVGFSEYSNFSNYFKKKMGVTPSRFRKNLKSNRNLARIKNRHLSGDI